jgi:hypothetical protein
MMDPMRWAQGLIEQLPASHEGRNSWLLNYGIGTEAEALRATWHRRHPDYPQFRAKAHPPATEKTEGGE